MSKKILSEDSRERLVAAYEKTKDIASVALMFGVAESTGARELLSKVDLEGKTVLGDKAFCSARIRDFIQAQGGTVGSVKQIV